MVSGAPQKAVPTKAKNLPPRAATTSRRQQQIQTPKQRQRQQEKQAGRMHCARTPECGLTAEGAQADSYLDGVDAGIWLGHSGVGDVHEPDFGAEIVISAKEVSAKSPAGSEINLRSALRDLGVGEERSAFNFKKGLYFFW